jgi:hypothetical protein
MLVTAKLDESTVKRLLDELLPVKVMLDDDGERGRWIEIEAARHVDFVPGAGLRVLTGGQLQWKAAGLPIGVAFNSAQLMLQPLVEDDEHGGRLVFRPSLEALDLKNVPAFLDSGLLAVVNSRLAARGEDLGWRFGRTLALQFLLPGSMQPRVALRLGAGSGQVEVLEDSVVFSLVLAPSFEHRGDAT